MIKLDGSSPKKIGLKLPKLFVQPQHPGLDRKLDDIRLRRDLKIATGPVFPGLAFR